MRVAASDLQIRRVDPDYPEEMRVYQRLYEEAERAELPDASVYSLADTVAVLTRAPLGWFYEGYAAFEAGEMVGEGLIVGSTTDSLHTARLWAWVAPRDRGRGVGGAMAAYLVERCRELDRGVLQTSARYPFSGRDSHPYRRFAESQRFAPANVEVERRLALPVSRGLLDSLAEQARARHAGYALRTVIGSIPTDLAPGYCEVGNRLRVEAPPGDLVVEAARRTPEVLADQDAELIEQGRTRVTVVALDPGGNVVALTCAVLPGPGEPQIDQWSTIVAREHRGHRLGLSVKAAATAALQDAFPDKRFVTTTNAETNTHMIAVNEALGFERYALTVDFQRILPGYDLRA